MMKPERWERWSDWEASAVAVLRRGHTSSQRPIAPFQRLFLVLIFPARVQCAESWTVFWDTDAVTRQQRRYVSYLRWRRDIDGVRFKSPGEIPTDLEPTIEYKETALEHGLVEGLLEKFRRASVPALVMPESYPYDTPLDGTMHEVVLGGVFTLSQFRWHTGPHSDEPPPEWRALGKAVRETLISLREVIGEKQDTVA